MARQGIRSLTLALAAGTAIATAQAAERDVLGWEAARWGMDERELKEAFSSKVLAPLSGEHAGETVLNIPCYVFLGGVGGDSCTRNKFRRVSASDSRRPVS